MARNDVSAFWTRVEAAMRAAGKPYSQMGIAKLLGMSQGSIQRWVRGTGLPTMKVAIRIAQEAGVQVQWLLTGDGLTHPIDPKSSLGELVSLYEVTDDIGREEVVKFARYRRTISFTGDPKAREELHELLARKSRIYSAMRTRKQ